MNNSPYLIVNLLVLKGIEKNYIAKFEEGLNIIWGDVDSGKSSILNLIDYCLGGSIRYLKYGEIHSKGRVAYLEANMNGVIYTFERDTLNEKSPVKVYSAPYDQIHLSFPRVVSVDSTKKMPDGWLSDLILESLSIPTVNIKESGIRENAESDRLSFRDLMKLLYLSQAKVGSEALLNYGNYSVFQKNIEIQKFVYNIHDEKLTSIQDVLSSESKQLASLQNSEKSVAKFLADVNIKTHEFDTEFVVIEEKEDELEALEAEIKKLKSDFKFSSKLSNSISSRISGLKLQQEALQKTLFEIDTKFDNFIKLKNTYQNDLDNLTISQISRTAMVGLHDHAKTLPCPLCASQISILSERVNDDDIKHEAKSIKNRISGIDAALNQLRRERSEFIKHKDEIATYLEATTKEFDETNIENISPLISNIEAAEKSKSFLRTELSELHRNSAIVNKYNEILKAIDTKINTISGLRRLIETIEKGLINIDETLAELTFLLKTYLKNSGLQNVFGVKVDKKFISYFRDISYYDTSSGGVRTITSIGSFIIRLQYLLNSKGNLPTFLMIDTPGQNIGRYSRDDEDVEISDPALYENIYKQITEVIAISRENDKKCQIIVVDNDLPHFLEEEKDFHLVKRFSKHGGKFEKGLINDVER